MNKAFVIEAKYMYIVFRSVPIVHLQDELSLLLRQWSVGTDRNAGTSVHGGLLNPRTTDGIDRKTAQRREKYFTA